MRHLIILSAVGFLAGADVSVAQNNDQVQGTGQVGVTGQGSDTGSLPPGWDGEIGDALFLDTGAGTLRPEPQFRENFSRLSPQQQAAVRAECTSDAIDEPATDEPDVTRGTLVRLCSWLSAQK